MNPEVQFYSAERAYEESTVTSPLASKPFTSVFNSGGNNEIIIEPDKFMTPLSFQAKSLPESDKHDSNMEYDYVRATADFASGVEIRENKGSAKKIIPCVLEASLNNLAIGKENEDKKEKIDSFYNSNGYMRSPARNESLGQERSFFETWKFHKETQLTHRKISRTRKEQLTKEDSETEPAISRELYSRRGLNRIDFD